MSRFALNLFLKNSIPALSSFTSHWIHHTPLKLFVTSGFQKCYKSSSSQDLSNLIDCPLSDDFNYEEESSYSQIDIEEITNGDPQKLKALKLVQLEIDLMSQHGEPVPSSLKTEQWKETLLITSKAQRHKYFRHLWIIERKKEHRREELKIKAKAFAQFKAGKELEGKKILTTNSPVEYSLTDNTIFFRIRDPEINRLYNYKLLQAEWFGPSIIIDCSYESFMTFKNTVNCARQMLFMWSDNRYSFNPYDLFFCNVNQNSIMWNKFAKHIQIDEDVAPVHFTEKHYLELYPKEKLVYLTPHCKETLDKYNPDDIYIIGAFVDANKAEPVSLAKAKKEGIRMAKFPLDRYLQWSVGTKSLTINQVICILNDLKDGQSWSEAFKHVPQRKVASIFTEPDSIPKCNHLTSKAIRENYRKNLVYDLLMKEKLKAPENKDQN